MSAELPKNVGLRKNGLRKSVLQRSLVGASLLLSLAGCDAGGNGGPPVVEPGSAIGSQPGAGGSSNPDTTIPGSGGAGGPGGGTEWTSQCASPELGTPGLRRLTRRELEQTLRDIFPSLGAAWTSALSADSLGSSGFDNDNELLVVSKQAAREIATTAETVGENLAAAQASLLPCAAGSEATCAGQFLDVQGRRLFRRPLTATERSTFLTFWNTAFTATGSFAQSVGWLSRALIESPEFVYRREIGTADGGSQRLDQFEIASELAYTFSGTAPSNELLDRAGRGELSSPQVLVQTARELLNTSGRGVVQSFFDAYVGHARITTIAKAGVPGFAEQREAMLEETRHFIEEVVFNRGGGVRELLTADFTTPSRALAAFYEFTGDSLPASDYQVVPRPEGHGIGLLAQGSVLATLAQPNGSSPTKRGLWIFKHLLCNSVPPVPPNIPELKPPVEGQITTRQRYAEQHATGACQGCHSRWDPIGFGFEHFNEAGQYREKEGGLDIDTSSHVPQAGQTLFEFDGQEDLMTQLAELPLVHECLSGYLATYAFGEELTCAAESQRGAFISGEIGVLDYLASLAGEPHFTQRAIE
ncbi:MAG: hypothetical protein RL685_1252 [Pseudomonadota bacterium]|jgi:hypothetical protein